MENYLEYDARTNKAKYVSDLIVKGRRICLYGISVVFTQKGDSAPQMEPCFPAPSSLVRLIKANPEYSEFSWNGETKIWSIVEC